MLKVKQILSKKTSAGINDSGRDVVHKIMESGTLEIPVLNTKMQVVGSVGMLDILRATNGRGSELDNIKVGQFMIKQPITADKEMPLNEVAKLMVENNLLVIPIVQGERFVGVISASDILDTYVKAYLYSYVETGLTSPTTRVQSKKGKYIKGGA
jgi:CBS domain-containing protein